MLKHCTGWKLDIFAQHVLQKNDLLFVLESFLVKVSLSTLRLRRLSSYQQGGKVARENLTEEVCQSFKMKMSGWGNLTS